MTISQSMPSVARQAVSCFRDVAGDSAGVVAVGWAPGRINIIGEHTDYNEGFVLPAAINRLVALAGVPTDEPYASLYSQHHSEWTRISLTGEEERGGEPAPLWSRYVRATWGELSRLGATPEIPGFRAVIVGDVPLGGGLSSSAALEVATAMFAHALGGAALPAMEVARACQRAERLGADVAVGIMDQAASCLGKPHAAMLLDCRSETYEYVAIPEEASWVIFDTGAPHTLAASGYNTRRGECEKAVALLAPLIARDAPNRSIRALRDVTEDDLTRYGTALGDVLPRARHVVRENARTRATAEALSQGDMRAVGAYLNASHASLRDDYEVSCAELDVAAQIAQDTPGVLGARMMGAGFGGSIIALAQPSAVERLTGRLASEYPQRSGRIGALVPCELSGETGSQTTDERA